ncbi:hypothetical protein ACLOJK_017188 [Asimina triloba]
METMLLSEMKKQASSFIQDKYRTARLILTDVTPAELSQSGGILDPHVVKTKGRTAKRAKGPLEDASWDCKFFRWLDDKGHSRSNIKIESHPHTDSRAEQHKDIVVYFGDLVCCVDALKDSQLKEATKWKQAHMAMRDEIHGLKETTLRRNLDARIIFTLPRRPLRICHRSSRKKGKGYKCRSSVVEEIDLLFQSYQSAREELQAVIIQMEGQLNEQMVREANLNTEVENLKAELTKRSKFQSRITELEDQMLLAETRSKEEVESVRAATVGKEAHLTSQLEGHTRQLQERDALNEQIAQLEDELSLAHAPKGEKEAEGVKKQSLSVRI